MKVVKESNKIKLLKVIIPLIILISLLTFFTCIIITPKIELTDDIIKLKVGTNYKETGYKVTFNNKDISDKVKIKGTINNKKIGTYYLTYELKYFLLYNKKIKKIEVVDDEAPTIELLGNKEVYICPNDKYQEEGYQVIDNYDKDLTTHVKIKEKDNVIYYEVTDASGNKTRQERVIYYEDKENPKITLKGKSKEYIYRGTNYIDSGYEVTDNCDKDIANKVKVTNNINNNQLGIYEVNYQVTDLSGNTTTITRTVQVIEKVKNETGTIYLTFDDGPSSTITASVLDILKSEGVKATFFVINKSDDLNYLIKREYNEGHTVALHSYTHDYAKVYSSKENYFKDLNSIQTKVKNITGETSMIIRFPGGSSNTISKRYHRGIMSILTKEVVAQGYHYFDWNVSSGDAGGVKSSDEVYRNVVNGLSANRSNIVLMHDFENNYYTLNALRAIIKYGKDNGYTFKNITMDTNMITHNVTN